MTSTSSSPVPSPPVPSPPVPSVPLIADESPVRGLTRRQLPFVAVVAQSVAAIAPAGTSAVTPLFVIVAAGGARSIAAFLTALVVIMFVALCIRPMAQRVAVVGGLYSYVAQAYGARTAMVTAWSAVVGYTAVSVAGLMAVGLYTNHIAISAGVTQRVSQVAMSAIVVLAAVVMAFVMIRGVKVSAVVILCIELLAVVVMVALMLWLGYTHRDQPWRLSDAHPNPDGSLALSVVVAVSAFVGFESSTTLSAEARRPFRSVPRALLWTPLLAGVIYLLAVSSQSAAMAGASESVRESSTPLAALFLSDGSPVAAVILDVGIATSFLACAMASVNALVRVLFTLGREHIIPKQFGATHRRLHTPAFATAIATSVVALGPLMFLWFGGDPEEGVRDFLTLSALGYMGSYVAACLAAPRLLRRMGELTRPLLVASWGTASGLVILLGLGATMSDSGDRVTFLCFFGSVAVVAIAVVVIYARWPARFARVGVFDETNRDDVLALPGLR